MSAEVLTRLAGSDGHGKAEAQGGSPFDGRFGEAPPQITSRQEDPEGEDELEPAFKVESPQAIGCHAM